MPDAIIGGAVSGLGSLFGASQSSSAATSAAKAQADAANRATALQAGIFGQTQNNLAPFIGLGNQATNDLIVNGTYPNQAILPPALMPPTPFNAQQWFGPNAQQTLEQTPGYQFTLGQGLRGVQNSAAAQGRGVSGNALAGAANYTTGLANQTFNQQFQNALGGSQLGFNQALQGQGQQYNQQLTNTLTPFDYLNKLISLGANSAAGLGQTGVASGANIANSLTGAGNAQASGIIGSANALTSGVGGAANSIGNLFTLNSLTGGLLFGGSGGGGGGNLQSPGFSSLLNSLPPIG